MKFTAEPNLTVRLKPQLGLIKYIQFDENGNFETTNELLIKRCIPHFASKQFSCKKCDYTTDKKGELLYHYRSHKEDLK